MGASYWANLHLLFWLSLVPVTTAWMGENHFGKMPVALYGFVMLMAGFAYFILSKSLTKHHENNILTQAVGKDKKTILSLIFYATAIPLAFILPVLSIIIYVIVAVIWFIPDSRIENRLSN